MVEGVLWVARTASPLWALADDVPSVSAPDRWTRIVHVLQGQELPDFKCHCCIRCIR
jgi:hypothetical protein